MNTDNNVLSKEESEKLAKLEKDVEDAEKELDDAKEALKDAKEKQLTVLSENSSIISDAQSKENAYNLAKFAVQSQEKTIENLEDSIEKANDSYNSSVKSYDNLVATQESALESVKSNKEISSLTSSTDMEQAQVDLYEEQLEKIMVKAPISGIVTSVNFDNGDTYKAGPIVIIQDCSEYEIEAYVGEYDISDIIEGQKVLIKTDATRDEELEGIVDFISPTGIKAGTDTTYKIRIKLNNKNDRLRLDMSASLSIITAESNDAITVPYNAIQKDEDGNTFVEVINEDGTLKKIIVEVLMESNYYTEIKENNNIKIGDKVRIIIEESSMNPLEMLGVF